MCDAVGIPVSLRMNLVAAFVAIASFFLFPGIQIASSQFKRDNSYIHLFSLSMLFSAGANTMMLYLLGLVSTINLRNVVIIFVLTNLIMLFIFRNSLKALLTARPVFRFSYETPLLFVPLLIWFGILLNSSTWPFAWWDALATFNPVALYLLRTGSVAGFLLPGFAGGPLYSTGIWYPLGLPMSFLWGYLLSGSIDENVAHAMMAFFMLMLLGYSYLFARQVGGAGKVAAVLVAICPTVLGYALGGYADLPAAAFFVATAYYGTKWITILSRIDVLFSGVSAGLTAWMKPQGLFTVLVLPALFLVVCIARRDRRYLLKADVLGILGASELFFLVPYIYTTLAVRPGLIAGNAVGYFTNSGISGSSLSSPHNAFAFLTLLGHDTIVAMATLFRGEVALQSPVLAALALCGLAFSLTRKMKLRLFPGLLCLSYLALWTVTSPTSDRYLLSFFAVALPLTSLMLRDIFFRLNKSHYRALFLIVLLVLLAQPTFSAVTYSIQGYGPSLTWSMSHLNTPINEKRDLIMGDMWRIADYASSHPQIVGGGRILVTDSRMRDWIFNATYSPSLPPTETSLCRFSNVITQDSVWNFPQFLENLRQFLTLVHQDGDWRLYSVNCYPTAVSPSSMLMNAKDNSLTRCESQDLMRLYWP
jgi:hypothetical protein